MKRKLKQILALLVVASVGLYASESRTLDYLLVSEKTKIGEIHQEYVLKNKNLFVYTQSHLKLSSEALDLEESSLEEYEGLDTLVRSEAYTLDNADKVLYKTVFSKEAGDYSVIISEKKEIDKNAVAMFKAYQKLKGQSKNSITLKMKELANTKVELNAFDTTENVFAFYLKNRDLTKSILTLSFDDLSIDETKVSDLGMVELNIDNKVLLTHYYKLEIKDKKPSYLWIAEENSSMPYVVRVKGSDESGEFELILKSIK